MLAIIVLPKAVSEASDAQPYSPGKKTAMPFQSTLELLVKDLMFKTMGLFPARLVFLHHKMPAGPKRGDQ